MLASDSRLMPDQPGKGPPSSAPLSVEDADRLADSFTPFWEDDGASSATAAPTPVPAPPPAAAAEVPAEAAAAPAPLTLPVRKQNNKQTLFGIAPLAFTPGAPAAAPLVAAPSATTTQPLPALAPNVNASPALTGSEHPHKKTLFGFSPLVAAAPLQAPALSAAPSPGAAPSAAPATVSDPFAATAAVQGATNVPGYATKYTPKDGPATPAVVIAPEAQSSPEAASRPLSATQPSRVRAAPAPVTPSAYDAPASDESGDVDQVYLSRKKPGTWVAVSIGVILLLLGGVFGIRALSRERARPGAAPLASASAPAPLASAASAATAAAAKQPTASAPVVLPATAEPTPPPVIATASAPVTPPPAAPRAKVAKARSEAVAPPTPRPAPRTPSTAAFPAEPPAPPAKPGKSVIVRDAPF